MTLALTRIQNLYACALLFVSAAAMGNPTTALARNHKVVVLDFDDPDRSGVRQVVLDLLADQSDVDLLLTDDVKMIAKQSSWDIDSQSDRNKLAKESGIDEWVSGSVTEKWKVTLRIIGRDGKIKGKAEFGGKRKTDLLKEVSQRFWFALGYLVSKSANAERNAWLKEQARQKGLAAHRELAQKKAEARQKELMRQKELALKREQRRLDKLDAERRVAVQKASARNDELARQRDIARRRELAKKREMERQMELARKEQLAKQQEYEKQQRLLFQQQELARRQELARQQALAQQRSMAAQPPPVVQQPAITPSPSYGQQASVTYGQALGQTAPTAVSQSQAQRSPSIASLYYGLQTSGGTGADSTQQPATAIGQMPAGQPATSTTTATPAQQPLTSSSQYGVQLQPVAPPSTAYGQPATTATAQPPGQQSATPGQSYYGQPATSTTTQAATQPSTPTAPYYGQPATTATAPYAVSQPVTRQKKTKTSWRERNLSKKKARSEAGSSEDDGCSTLAIKPGSSKAWLGCALILFMLLIRRQQRRNNGAGNCRLNDQPSLTIKRVNGMTHNRINSAMILSVLSVISLLSGCDFLRRSKPEAETTEKDSTGSIHIPIPIGISDELREAGRPVFRVELIDDGTGRMVPVPFFYGYPFYGTIEAKVGIYRFREDVWTGYTREQSVDNDGVTYLTETFPEANCTFYGILETSEKYIPMYLECLLPPPNNLGGRKRPIVGNLLTGATAQEILDEPSIKQIFLGDWHAVTPDFENSDGTGYFNTEHGQIGFGFKEGKLHKLVYMFDPPVKVWRSPEIWVTH
ncbi:MAG: hypothetical protein JXA30_04375 [Deltaproteobacteria bacterium]|nr:hypothetical protein [Deltaproteobacteria bacterium]